MGEEGSAKANNHTVSNMATGPDEEGEESGSQEGSQEGLRLKRNLGLFNGVAVIVGLVVGSGIFISPVGVLEQAGSVGASLVFWVIGGLAAAIGSTCYVELGTMIKESGGDYTYIGRGFGATLQFCYVWASILIIFPVTNAIVAMAFSYYVLTPVYPTCEPPEQAVALLAACVIILLTAINSLDVKWAAIVMNIFTVAKIAALVIIVIAGFILLGQGRTTNFENAFANTNTDASGWARAIYAGVYAYAGWNYLNLITEEVKEPHKTLPRSIWISIPLITSLYILANVAFFAALTIEEMKSSNAVAVTFGAKVMPAVSWLFPIFVACSTFGSLNGCIFTSSRLYYVAARNGQLPQVLSLINVKFTTPIVSLVFQCLISLVILISSDIFILINYATFVETMFTGLSIAAMLVMRWKYPELHRPIKVHLFFPIAYLVFCLFLLIMTLWEGATESLIGIVIIVSAVPVYWIGVLWKNKPKPFVKAMRAVTVATQKVFYCRPEDLKVS